MVLSRCATRKITLPVQAILLKKKYPESNIIVKQNTLVWLGKIRPTPFSREYHIEILCEKGNKPIVYLCEKNIEGIEKEDFPHFYPQKGKKQYKNKVHLCLNLPVEFDYSFVIADTLIPWAQEWLFFYEIWLITGEWKGGGHVLST